VPARLRGKVPPPPTGHLLAIGSLVAIAIVSLLTLAQNQGALDALVLPTATLFTAIAVLPLGQLVLLWLGTLGKAKAKPTLPLGFVLAALLVLGAAAVNAIVASAADVKGGAFATGSIELTAIGVPTILAAGALYHWGKKLFGAPLSPLFGGLVLLLLTGGTLAVGFGWLLAGYTGAPAHLKDWTDSDLQGPFVLGAAGHGLLLLGGLVLVLDIIRAMVAGSRSEASPPDLDDGITLEWATPTPVPPGNFEEIPDVRSSTPTLDLVNARSEGGAS
jgi:heme/copper-type cytochrome/quinol oxidase subunit 1